MSSLDSYIVNISLPTISKYFNVSTSLVSRVLLVYLVTQTSTLLIFGKMGDKFGVKRVFIWGYFFFVSGSLLCGTSDSIHMLTISRFIQGLGVQYFSRYQGR